MLVRNLVPLLAAALLLTPPLAAANAQEVSLGTTWLSTRHLFRSSYPLLSLEGTYMRSATAEGLGRMLYWGGGLRAAYAPDAMGSPVELFARSYLVAELGPWQPAAGMELGLNLAPLLTRPQAFPVTDELPNREASVYGFVYLAFHAAPLRWRLFDRFMLSAAELQVGAIGPPLGTSLRIQVGLLRVGVML